MAWERIWGPTESVVVDAATGAVYAKPAAAAGIGGGVYRWDGTPFGWKDLGGNGVSYVTAGWAPHSALYGIDAAGEVSRYDEGAAQWMSIGGPCNGRALKLYGGPDRLTATAPEGPPDVFGWDEGANSWERIGGPAKKIVVGKASDPEFRWEIYGQSPDDAPAATKGIYKWAGGNWVRQGGPAGDIIVSQQQLFATNPVGGDLMMKDAGGWRRIGGPGQQFATDHRGHVYAISPGGGAVYRWKGIANQWEQIGGPASAIFAGWDGQLFALNPETSDLWAYRGVCPAVVAVPSFDGIIRTPKMNQILGARNVLVVLWDPHRPDHPRPTRQAVESLVFGPKPSLRDWIEENSGGRATLANAGVLGWYDAPPAKQGDHYWDGPDADSPDPAKRSPTYHQDKYHDGWLSGHVEKWADAVRRAAQDIDLAAFDANHDGVLSTDELGVFLCYPQNQSDGFERDTDGQQWPNPQPLVVDGVHVPTITEWYLGAPPHFGTAAHELAHLALHTPDMYFTDFWPYAAACFSSSDQGRGQHLSAPEKLKLGWLDFTVVTHDGVYELPDVESSRRALVLMSPKRGGDEYFLLENRWRGNSYDAGAAGIQPGIWADGLAIWHVIEDPAVFNTVDPWPPTGVPGEWGRLGIRLIRANGVGPIDDAHALFTGGAVSDVTSPANLRWLHDRPSGIRVKVVDAPGPVIRLEVGIGCP